MKSPQGLRGLAAAIGASLAALCIAVSPVAAPDAAAQVDAPALWRAAGPKGSVYLFGSFHLLPADVKWRTPAVESALSQAAVVVFETDFAGAQDPQALIAKYGFLPPGQTLRSLLPTSTNAELEKTASELEIPPLSLAPLRPWLAALTLGVHFAIHQGFDPSNGVEQQVITSAKASGKSLGTLETNESQLKVFADLAALERTLNVGFDDFPMLRKRILKDRHDRWLPQIEKMIADGRTHMIIVGAAHLVGPDSVIAMLRAKGVKVEGP